MKDSRIRRLNHLACRELLLYALPTAIRHGQAHIVQLLKREGADRSRLVKDARNTPAEAKKRATGRLWRLLRELGVELS